MTRRRMLLVGLTPIVVMAFYACQSSESASPDAPPDVSGEDTAFEDATLDGARAEDATEAGKGDVRDAPHIECCPIQGSSCGCYDEVSLGGSPDGGVCVKWGGCDIRYVGVGDSAVRLDPNGCPYIGWSDFRDCRDTGAPPARDTGIDTGTDAGVDASAD